MPARKIVARLSAGIGNPDEPSLLEARPLPQPMNGEELMALTSEEFVIRMWPVTVSNS